MPIRPSSDPKCSSLALPVWCRWAAKETDIHKGDVLLAIDGDDVQGRGFKAVMDQLRYDTKGALLVLYIDIDIISAPRAFESSAGRISRAHAKRDPLAMHVLETSLPCVPSACLCFTASCCPRAGRRCDSRRTRSTCGCCGNGRWAATCPPTARRSPTGPPDRGVPPTRPARTRRSRSPADPTTTRTVGA